MNPSSLGIDISETLGLLGSQIPNVMARTYSSPNHSVAGFRNLAIELYNPDQGRYVFDANRVIFLDVDKRVFAVLEILRDKQIGVAELQARLPQFSEAAIEGAVQEIERLQQRGYLLPMQSTRHTSMSRADFEETLSNRVHGLTIHITSQCNLACSYCIFGGNYERHAELSQNAMSLETAKNTVDFLIAHAKEAESLRLDFFGGEPLLAFSLIKRTVEYLKQSLGIDDRPVVITIATNGTVVSDAILQFLVAHQVLLQVSIDGERDIHDRERRFRRQNRGSFDLITANLQRIHDHDAKYFQECLRIKSVVTMDSLHEDDGGFWKHPLIKLIRDNQHDSLLIQEPSYVAGGDAAYFNRLYELGESLLQHRGATELNELTQNLNWRQRAFYSQTFGQFAEVQAVNMVRNVKEIGFTKGCMMGYQEGAVQPNGDIGICHKSTSFVIGNVNDGQWDFDRIESWHNRLFTDWPECSSCFAMRFCDLCYEKLDGSNDNLDRSRAEFCKFTRHSYHVIFEYMLRILERNPGLWNAMRTQVQEDLRRREKEISGAAGSEESGGVE